MARQVLTEATTTPTATPVEGKPGKFLIQLITPGWGTSGYYSPDVLEAAAGARVFPAGLHMYLDHEHLDGSGIDMNGNRSVKDLAAVLESDATWNGQALVGVASVFGPYREALSNMAESIGVSIRASADVAPGEAEGRTGIIVGRLVEGYSADFVTRAGRGGKILQVIESARTDIAAEAAQRRTDALTKLAESRNIGQWIESRLHLALTCQADDMYGDGYLTREERIALSSAVGDALDAFTAALQKSAPQLYERDLWDDPSVLAAQVDESTKNVPANPAGRNNKPGGTMPEIAESELRTLREAAGRVHTLESERDAAAKRAETAESERDEARTERDKLREAEAQRGRAATVDRILGEAVEAANGVTLNEFERAGIAGRAVVKDGAVDESATRTAFDKAVASIREARGHGRPRGLGGPVRDATESGSDMLAELDRIQESTFGPIATVKES